MLGAGAIAAGSNLVAAMSPGDAPLAYLGWFVIFVATVAVSVGLLVLGFIARLWAANPLALAAGARFRTGVAVNLALAKPIHLY